MVVAVAVGRSGIDNLLVISQVVLAICLPFVTFPLIWLTSSKKIMSVRKHPVTTESEPGTTDPEGLIDFSSGKIATGVGILMWLIMFVANGYVIITLAMGSGGWVFFTVDTEFSWVDFGVWTLQSCYCEQENKLRRDELRPQIGTFEAYIRRVLYTCEPNKDI